MRVSIDIICKQPVDSYAFREEAARRLRLAAKFIEDGTQRDGVTFEPALTAIDYSMRVVVDTRRKP